MVDNIEPLPFLIVMALLVTVWLALGIRDRRRARRRVERLGPDAPRCSLLWEDGIKLCVCDRPHEHTGPHVDSFRRVLLREDGYLVHYDYER